MAIVLEANYSKKLGLPDYSSHQYSVSIRSELQDLTQVPEESARLYHMLQDSVDSKIQESGYLPNVSPQKVKGLTKALPVQTAETRQWECSDKQKRLICDLMTEHHIEDESIDKLSRSMFQKPLFELSKFKASGIIGELFNQYGKPLNGSSQNGINGRKK
jgi:hypothetical protein